MHRGLSQCKWGRQLDPKLEVLVHRRAHLVVLTGCCIKRLVLVLQRRETGTARLRSVEVQEGDLPTSRRGFGKLFYLFMMACMSPQRYKMGTVEVSYLCRRKGDLSVCCVCACVIACMTVGRVSQVSSCALWGREVLDFVCTWIAFVCVFGRCLSL
jgi:hypothetical protein